MRTKTAVLAIAAAALLSGCATSRTVMGQDGRPLHKISCDGSALSIDACYEKAGELCGSAGYDVVNQDGSARPFMVYTPGMLTTGAAVYRTVWARCRS